MRAIDTSQWSTQQLAQFVAAVSVAELESSAAMATVEQAAAALDADVAAIVCGGELVAAIGYPDGKAPVDELQAIRPGRAAAVLEVPGIGACVATSAALDHPPGATLVIARPDALTREETGLVRGMAQVASMTMRTLGVLGDERAAREELEHLARDKAGLRRVATLVAEAAPRADIYTAVAREIAQHLGAEIVEVVRYETDGTATIVGGRYPPGVRIPAGARLTLTGDGSAGPLRSIADHLRSVDVRSRVQSPIVVDNDLWGIAIAASTRREAFPAGTDARIAAFTELVATAIANAEARAELRRITAEQAALRRVATLIARGVTPDRVVAAVAEEAGRVVPAADVTWVGRYDSDGHVEFVDAWSREGDPSFAGGRVTLGGHNVATLVHERNEPARVDHLADDEAPATALARQWARSAAGAPINVEGRLWGVMTVASAHAHGLPAGIEHELADFTDLVATAIANAQSRRELNVLAAEQAALRRVATLVARGEQPAVVFAAVAEEVGRLLSADVTRIGRFLSDGTVTDVAGWNSTGEPVALRGPISVGGRNVATRVFETGRPAQLDSHEDATGAVAEDGGATSPLSSAGAPISVAGRLWGVTIASSTHQNAFPPDTELRLAQFTELVAMGIANSEARNELRQIADEQAALRRVATLVARGVPARQVFEATTSETRRVLDVDASALVRLEDDGSVTVVAADSALPVVPGVGRRMMPVAGTSVQRVLKTGCPARVEAYAGTAGSLPERLLAVGYRGSLGAPVIVHGRVWGVMVASWSQARALPPGSEERLKQFTELAATAIANANARAELKASRMRIVASADETRRRVERDLHDGAQQRLVTLALEVRAVRASVPAELAELAAELDTVTAGLNTAFDELRDFARGIHPSVLVEGGLRPALRALGRRSPIPVDVDVRVEGRLPDTVEVGAYRAVSEGLTNAVKHAGATSVAVEVTADDELLRISVRDDGVGGADFGHGTGLVELRDRVEALGGGLTLRSDPGRGTSLSIELPLSVDASAAGS